MAAGLAALTALASAATFGATAAVADADLPSADAQSAGHGHGLWIDGLGLDVASTASSSTEFPGAAGPETSGLDLALLQTATVDANGLTLPLLSDGTNGGLLALGDLGALSSYSASPSATSSVASSGIITEDGGIDLGPVNDPSSFTPAQLDASALVRQLLGDAVADELLDEATLSVGALASRVDAENGAPTSEYSLSGLELELSSPAVGGLVDDVDGLAAALLDPVDALLAEGGSVDTLVTTLVGTLNALPLVDASVNSIGLDTTPLTGQLREQLLEEPVENGDGSVSVNLNDGTITVYLDQLAISGQPGETLSTLAPNTDVLSGDTVTAILNGVSEALVGPGPNSLVTKATTLITEGVYGVGLTIDLEVGLSATVPVVGTEIPVAGGSVLIEGTLGGILGQAGYDPLGVDTSDVTLLPGLPIPVDLGAVLQPVVNAITPVVSSIGAAILPVLTTTVADIQPSLVELLEPIVTGLLDEALEPVLTQVLDVTINEQPEESDLGAEGFTVRALSVTLLPLLGDASVDVQLGSASAFAEAAAATLTAAPNPVEQGGTVTLTGGGFTEGEDVTITFPDGTTETVTAAAGGAVTATWEVPADYAPGTASFSATGGTSGLTATATTEVAADAAATLTATPNPVEQGGTVTLTGGGFTEGEDVTIAFPDGTTETVTAAAGGAVTATWEVPADYEPGEATFTATGATSGLTATATTVVEADADAEVNANASASASASADAAADDEASASAQAAAQAAANADNTSDASAAADVSANAAAEAAATADASAEASAETNAA
ncbi:choice-of-anchor G family protein, partial [Leucobacter chromiiresistens]